jgi:hypothetical protein
MQELERLWRKSLVHLPPYKVPRSACYRLSGRRKKAQLFRCKEATSNAVNAYPMPNRHELFQLKLASQPVRIRHFGRHKCREPAIAEEVGCFLIKGMRTETWEKAYVLGRKLSAFEWQFSRYTVTNETRRNGFCEELAKRARRRRAERSRTILCAEEALRKSVDPRGTDELASQLLPDPALLRRHSLYP